MECNQIVPLLSASPDDLTLVVGRRAAPMFDETDELFVVDENEDEHQTSMNNAEETINENEISIPNNNNSYPLLSQSKTSTV
jgi:hypothetical protein